MTDDYRQGYLAALADVEREADCMPPVGNLNSSMMPHRQPATRIRHARITELGSQKLAVLRITQHLRKRGAR